MVGVEGDGVLDRERGIELEALESSGTDLDGSGRGRYLLSWPDTASNRLGTPRITWQPAG